AVAGVATGNVHDKTQVGHDQLPGRLQILLVEQTISQLALFFDAEDRNAAYGLNIGLQVGTWNQVMYGLQSSAHICVNSKNIWETLRRVSGGAGPQSIAGPKRRVSVSLPTQTWNACRR